MRADEGRPDELGIAARGFDAMIAALRRSQAELEAFYRERMVRADRFAAVGEIATGLAHEIKNPLAGLSGALELLSEDLAANPQHAEVVGEMRHQVQRLTHTMESLLSFARPPKAKLRSTDVNGTLDKVLFLIRQQTRNGVVTVDPRARARTSPVLADPSQLEQVFLNICLNACQAMVAQRGGTLTVRSRPGEGNVIVEICDTGPGIPAGPPRPDLQAVLHHQARGERARPRDLRPHRGGARRPHRLPLPARGRDGLHGDPAGGARPARHGARRMTIPSARVLVVDDEKLIRWSVSERLQRSGYEVRLGGVGRAGARAGGGERRPTSCSSTCGSRDRRRPDAAARARRATPTSSCS